MNQCFYSQKTPTNPQEVGAFWCIFVAWFVCIPNMSQTVIWMYTCQMIKKKSLSYSQVNRLLLPKLVRGQISRKGFIPKKTWGKYVCILNIVKLSLPVDSLSSQHALVIVSILKCGWSYLSFSQLQRCNGWSLGMVSNFISHLNEHVWLLIHAGIKVNPCN